MKNTTLTFLMIAFLSPAAFAGKSLKCDLQIVDNDVHCGLKYLVGCPEKELKKSKTSFSMELEDGDIKSGEIKLKKVLLNPDEEKTRKKSDIVVFSSDDRDNKLKMEDEVALASFELSNSIKFNVQHNSLGLTYQMPETQSRPMLNGTFILNTVTMHDFSGDTIIEFKGDKESFGVIALQGNGSAQSFMPLVSNRAVKVECSISEEKSSEINQDELREKQAIEEFRQEQSKSQASKQ